MIDGLFFEILQHEIHGFFTDEVNAYELRTWLLLQMNLCYIFDPQGHELWYHL